MTVSVILFLNNNIHHTSVNQADCKRRGLKYFGRNFALTAVVTAKGGYQGNCSIKVFEVNVIICSQITLVLVNYLSC